MFRLAFRVLFNPYFWFVFLPLFLAWMMFGLRLEDRTYKASYQQLASVKQIWGGNLAQPMPSVRYKRSGSDVSRLSRGEIEQAKLVVDLRMDYRKKGLVYYTGYNVDFLGQYQVRNPENEKIYLSFIFPYPTRAGEGLLRDVKLLINGEEDRDDTEYQPNLALWTGVLEPEQILEFSLRYQGRGLDQFIHGFEAGHQINNFSATLRVHGAKELDYPVATMPPTEPPEDTEDGKILTWKLDRTQTQLNLGVILPDRLNVEQQLGVMSFRAPFFFLLFLVSVALIIHLAKHPPRFMPLAILSFTYFLFYPLFAYLLMYINLVLALALSFTAIGLMIFNYARLLYGVPIALAIALAYTLYGGVTTIAALLPSYTGLILTIEGVVIMGMVMQVFAHHREVRLGDLLQGLLGIQKTSQEAQNHD